MGVSFLFCFILKCYQFNFVSWCFQLYSDLSKMTSIAAIISDAVVMQQVMTLLDNDSDGSRDSDPRDNSIEMSLVEQCQCQMCHVGGGVTLSQHWHPSLVSLQLLCPHLRVSNPLHILSLVIIRQCYSPLWWLIFGIYSLHKISLSICPSHTWVRINWISS